MRVSAKVDYAPRAAIELAASKRGADGGYTPARPPAEIADADAWVLR